MRAAEFVAEKWSAKYKRSINCARPRGFSQRAHCAGRKKNEDVSQPLDEKCWDTHRQVGMKKKGDRMVPNCVPRESEEELNELSFKGSPCTKDCSGHRAGYEWSQRKGGQYAASWSPSFNNGAALFKNGF